MRIFLTTIIYNDAKHHNCLHSGAGCDSAHVQQFEGGLATVRYKSKYFSLSATFSTMSAIFLSATMSATTMSSQRFVRGDLNGDLGHLLNHLCDHLNYLPGDLGHILGYLGGLPSHIDHLGDFGHLFDLLGDPGQFLDHLSDLHANHCLLKFACFLSSVSITIKKHDHNHHHHHPHVTAQDQPVRVIISPEA